MRYNLRIGVFMKKKTTRFSLKRKGYDVGEVEDYLAKIQAQNDSAGLYKFKKALSEGKSKAEATKISRTRGKKK